MENDYVIKDRVFNVWLINSTRPWKWHEDPMRAVEVTRSQAHELRAAILGAPVEEGGRKDDASVTILPAEAAVEAIRKSAPAPVSLPDVPGAPPAPAPFNGPVALWHPTANGYYVSHTEIKDDATGNVTRTHTWDAEPMRAKIMLREEAERLRHEWQLPALVIQGLGEVQEQVKKSMERTIHRDVGMPLGPGQVMPSPPPPPAKMEYKILNAGGLGCDEDCRRLEEMVGQHLIEGWRPLGGVAVRDNVLFQAMGRTR